MDLGTARIVVVGAGQAGASLVARLRALGHSGPLTLVGAEPVPPYQRPPLSKAYLKGELSRERLFLRPPSFYEAEGIELLTATPAVAIDRAARELVLADGRRLGWDLLALTTGAVPRRLPAALGGGLAGVLTMRNLADADALAAAATPGARALIVGGGYIGLEAAAVLRERGLDVTLIEAAPRILSRVAAPATADYFRALHEGHGVHLREAAALARLAASGGRVTGAELADGTALAVDLVLVGIGIDPETALARDAELALENGIRVDAQGRTSDPGIFAAGDCASFPWAGARLRLESVPNAIDHAEAVAAAMLGDPAGYHPRPWFWSDQYDVKLQIAGLNAGFDRTLIRPGAPAGQPVGLVLARRPADRGRRDERPARLHDGQALDRGRPIARPGCRRRSGHRPQDPRLMRIIGGRHRGLALADLGAGDPAARLRPTSDRVRESLFNLLAHGAYGDPPPPEGRRVLDLFAGTGALGLEALSRGAAQASFVEQGRTALALLRRNLARLQAEEVTRVIARDATRLGRNPGPAFDLVFLDPPYGRGLGETALGSALAGGWVAPGGLVVWEEGVSPLAPAGLTLLDARRYGETMISIYRSGPPLPASGAP